MTQRALQVLEFYKIIDQLYTHAATSLGKEKVRQLEPSFDFDEVQHAQQATFEAVQVLRLKGQVPFGGIRDIRAAVERSLIGSMLQPHELLEMAQTLYGGRRLKTFMETFFEEECTWPILQSWTDQISSLKELEVDITACMDDQGDILDSASSTLRSIRSQMRNTESKIKQQLDQMTKSPSVQKMLQEALVTIRNDRYCLPVKAEHRAQFGGMVHDQSASGATLYMEPNAVVSLNNTLREAKAREEKEIERILRELTEKVAAFADPLMRNAQALAELDFIFAKAYYAQSLKATQPILNQDGYFQLKQARHPLIPAEEIVPISFELGQAYTSLVITGPNTGGKTVTLKTLGLLTLMSCSGLFIPAEEESQLAVVSSVYADIGDEQSIEQSLSTFSSHMTQIVHILEAMDEDSLVLLDELGAGTDPTEGAALAMAILDFIYEKGAPVVATTHYSELKAYAYAKEGVLNASVEFDVETLQPTYRLLVGVPGRSNAFAIAQRLGLDPTIIERARGQLGEDDSRVESMISALEENRKQAEAELEEAEQLRQEAKQLLYDLQKQEDQFQKEKERRLAHAEQKAQEYVAKKKRDAEQIIEQLREQQREGQLIKEHKLIEAKKQLEEAAAENEKQREQREKKQQQVKRKHAPKLRPGDEVYVHKFGQKGSIVEQVSDKEFLVQLGIMKMKVDRGDLEKVQGQPKTPTVPTANVQTSSSTTPLELDLRGKSIDEAIIELDQYLDRAVMDGLHQVHIIHGKGTGQLRKGVVDYLRKHRQVKSARSGEAGEGGSGVTVAFL